MRILIGEDDTIGRRMLQKSLSPYRGCDLASDGLEAINAFVLACSRKRSFDMVFLDIMMPLVDGCETLRMIRQSEDKCGIGEKNYGEVIIITGLTDRDQIARAAVVKSSARLVKPIRKVYLLKEMK